MSNSRESPASAAGGCQNPALSDRAIALVNTCLARVAGPEEAYRIGAAHSECIAAGVEPQEDLFRSAVHVDTAFEAQLLAREWIEDRKEEQQS